ncbi:MAG: hypothetical protein O6943_03960 [Bacteroidetes bacterium]|nr:hypothetical protein [Bacteroidota bacterium]
MKLLSYILIFLPALAVGQFDFDTRYFTIDSESLPDMPEISTLDMDFVETPSFQKKRISDFTKVTAKNYWQAVDMASVLEKERKMLDYSPINLPVLDQKEFGFSFFVNGSNSFDGTSRYGIKNIAYKYKEMRRYIYFCSPSGYYPARINK